MPAAPPYPMAQAAPPPGSFAPQPPVRSRFPTDNEPIDINQYTSRSLTWIVVLFVLVVLVGAVALLARFVWGLF